MNKIMLATLFFAHFVLGFSLPDTAPGMIPFSSPQWEFEAKEANIVTFQEKECLFLKNGIAYLKNETFLNGTLECEVFIQDVRAFWGLVFRMEDPENHEEFYLRAHQSGNPDANQYSPVFNGLSAWQLYHGPGYSKAYDYPMDKWMNIKIVVSDYQAAVYLNNESLPILVIPKLKKGMAPGMIGVKSGFGPTYFKNFSFQSNPTQKLGVEVPEVSNAPNPGTITQWEVSQTFPETSLKNKIKLVTGDIATGNWDELSSEPSGILNISRIRKLPENGVEEELKTNTVFAKCTIIAEETGIQQLAFGYSDRAKVYCNNQLLYQGNNGYRSRDYRYLGSIGYFDTISLPLKKGPNEIIIAISENFGGWGIMGRILK